MDAFKKSVSLITIDKMDINSQQVIPYHGCVGCYSQ